MPILSIIIPIYNAQNHLSQTIESVIYQSFKSFELILVDDGSTDSSLKICKDYALKDDRIIIKTQNNKGVSSARNNGLSVSTGQWVYFLDSDDLLNIEFINDISVFFDSDVDVIQFGSKRTINNEFVSYRQTLTNGGLKITSGINEFIETSNIGALCVWLHVINKKLIDKNKIKFYEDMQHNEDMLFIYQVLAASNKHVFIGKTLHTQRLIANSLSRSPISELKINNRLLLVDRLLDTYQRNPKELKILMHEANDLLKWYFGSLLELEKSEGKKITRFNKKYRFFYLENKSSLNTCFSKLGSIDIRIVLLLLKIRHLIFRR